MLVQGSAPEMTALAVRATLERGKKQDGDGEAGVEGREEEVGLLARGRAPKTTALSIRAAL